MAVIDLYADPSADLEHACRACGNHQGECDGPPARCCEACDHWTPQPLTTDDDIDSDDDLLAGQLLISITVDEYLAGRRVA